MLVSEFDYPLDQKNIAQTPASPRDSSKLMITNATTGEYKEEIFRHIKNYLGENDVLVVNDTQAIRARLRGYTVLLDGKKREVEVVLLNQKELDIWECAVFPGERLKPGKEVVFLDREWHESPLKATMKEITYGGRIVQFNQSGMQFWSTIDHIGNIPLPPYIRIPYTNISRYNTVYAKNPGSAAAPTAGLHFTKPLLEEIKKKGAQVEKVLLHIGLGTFKPVTSTNIEEHEIHTEYVSIDEQTATRLNEAKQAGKRIIAVGTTAVRTLEAFCNEKGMLEWGEKETNIFIYPGYQFRFVDSIITNFHLPKSTLVMMVSAFSGKDNILNWYADAQKKGYRFFSFGDAMWLNRE